MQAYNFLLKHRPENFLKADFLDIESCDFASDYFSSNQPRQC